MKKIEFVKFLMNDNFGHCVMIGNTIYQYEKREQKENDVFYHFLNTLTLKSEIFSFSDSALMKSEVILIF